jgi:ectoine hydroxylase-related dioxygenase (phytanoyl-CoA dioxygenase family)
VVDDLQALAGTDGHRKHARDPAAPSLCESAAVANAIAEPVSLWLARQYMQVAEIRLAHAPAVAVLPTDDGKRDLGKWHCDYPYHWGAGAASFVPTGTGETVLGVQRNVCISEFSKVRGATVFKLGSHALDKGPPDEWGTHSAYADPRFRAAHRVPYSGPEADVVEAPAGSILVYDARTWHRAGVNRTEQPRAAMILAHIPRYVMPKSNTGAQYQQFVASPIYQELNARQRLEMERLLVHRYVASNEPVDIG